MQEIVDVLHEVLLYFDCDCQSNDRRCDYCQNTTQKVHTIIGNMENKVGIIDDNNRIKDRPKDEWEYVEKNSRKPNKKWRIKR